MMRQEKFAIANIYVPVKRRATLTLTLRVRPKSSPFCHRDVAAHEEWFQVRVLSAPPHSLVQTKISSFSANSPELAGIRARILSLQSAH
jgi:hypothetical protein